MLDINLPAFRPRPPWLTGDLQTLRNPLIGKAPDLSPWPAERLRIETEDASGDTLLATLHRQQGGAGEAVAVIIHGLAGCEDSLYVMRTARDLLHAGWSVMRVNLRGAGPSRPLCRENFNAGRTGDIRLFIDYARERLGFQQVIPIGFSLGGNAVLKLLGEYGGRAPARGVPAAISVSAPIDLAATSRRVLAPRNWIYQRYILQHMKRGVLATPGLSAAMRQAIRGVPNVWRFDDVFTAPSGGYADAAEYYARNSAMHFLPRIEVPALIIHARDDPWIPVESYDRFDWAGNKNLIPALTRGGGHLGFHDRDHGLWHDMAARRFLAALQAAPSASHAAAMGAA